MIRRLDILVIYIKDIKEKQKTKERIRGNKKGILESKRLKVDNNIERVKREKKCNKKQLTASRFWMRRSIGTLLAVVEAVTDDSLAFVVPDGAIAILSICSGVEVARLRLKM